MSGAKMALVNYISRKPFAKTKKNYAYDESFAVSTISKIRNQFKHIIQPNLPVLQKFNTRKMHKTPSTNLNKALAPQTLTSTSKLYNWRVNDYFGIVKVKIFIVNCFPTYNTFSCNKYISNTSIATQLLISHSKPQFEPNIWPLNRSHSLIKSPSNALQTSDSEECEYSEQLSSQTLSPIFCYIICQSSQKNLNSAQKLKTRTIRREAPINTSHFAHKFLAFLQLITQN